ncbi:MAG: Holliday junction resolvase RuvX [Paludibacteraceae bacterium]|nr:Holliday junction resolvase RuvX [Paludibacteraceae bacterium]MDY6373429.1 Holliday junction resolvase RuvX [Bacteroidales bacterium]MDY6427046.1 Holliday junction resolvase RuvX [Bacteroidales bacterium]
MGRILAIDYGKKRVGLAVTDPLKIIAGGLTTVEASQTIDFLKKYTAQNAVELIVVGLPKTVKNTPSESMNYIRPFVGRLKKELPDIPVTFYDERFTSVLAHKTMLDAGLKKKDRANKALVDEISATIILQDYLISIEN